MGVTFRPAVRTTTSLLIALAGSSGSGKTYSALRLARGLAGPDGKIAFIDTERGRALHYAEGFTFDHAEIHPPFRPDRYQEAILDAEKAGFPVIVIDSMSHEHAGEGGLVEWAENDRQRMGSPRNWIAPKTAHKKLINRLLQVNAHLIFCLRAEPKIKMVDDPKRPGKQTVVDDGWKPVCEKTFMYEMLCSFMLYDEHPGVPVPTKLQEQHKFAFPKGQQITEACGQALAKWAAGGAAKQTQQNAAADAKSSDGQDAGAPCTPASEGPAVGSMGPAAGAPIPLNQYGDSPDYEGWDHLFNGRLAGATTDDEIAALMANENNKVVLKEIAEQAPAIAQDLRDAVKAAKARVAEAQQGALV